MLRCRPLLAITLLCSCRLLAQSGTLRANRASQPPSLGAEESWAGATTISDFRQREPYEGLPATEKTEVSVLYDRRFLYIRAHCFDSQANRIVATELRRDADLSVDDNFTVLLSPNNDGRNGYEFAINPLGTQRDSLIAEEGKTNDSNWDGVWLSSAQITRDGWIATITIPFSTLNFRASANQAVGINFRRFIRRKNEEDLWLSYLRIYGLERISQGGQLTDMREIGSGRLLVIKPYGLTGFRSVSGAGTRALHSAGGDLKYGIRSGLVANLTVNTDFADADVDPQQINLTPFRIFIPEKRPFFLENSGTFQFSDREDTTLFFSRQIGIDPVSGQQVPLDVGAKLTGSLGRFDVGLLEARTRESGPNPWANYLVGRVKRKLFSESYIGAIAIDKQSGSPADAYNRAVGLDANFVFFQKLALSGFAAKTASASPSLRGKDWAAAFDAAYNSNLIQAEAFRAITQPNFNPEVGFVDRTDIVSNFLDLTLSPRPASGPVREYNFEGFFRYQPDTHGVLQTQEWQTTFRANFHNGAYTDDDFFDNFIQRLNSPFNVFKNVFIPAGLYHFDRHQVTYGSDLSKRFVYGFFERFGSYYNGHLNEFRVRGSYHPNPKLAFSAVHTWDRFDLNRTIYNVQVGSFSGSYSFNRFLTSSALFQVNSVEDHPWSANLRVRYTYRPDSDLFVIYNVGSQFNSLAAGNPVLTRERRLSIKLTYSLIR